MPYDITAANRDATRVGLAMGAQMFNNSLRMQELQSMEASRRMQEAHVAQQMQFALEAHQMMLQQQADTAKANTTFQMLTSPTVNVDQPVAGPPTADNPAGLGSVPVQVRNPAFVPNVGEAYMKAYSGLARTPNEQGKLLLNAATLQLRQADTMDKLKQESLRGQPRPLAPEESALKDAQTRLAEAKIREVDAGRSTSDPEWVRSLKFYEERTGEQLSNDQVKELYDLRTGKTAKQGVAKVKSEADYVGQHIDRVMEQPVIESKDKKGGITYRTPQSRKEAETYLRSEYGRLFAPSSGGGATSTDGGNEKIWVVAPDGRKGQIPKRNWEKAKARGFKPYEG